MASLAIYINKYAPFSETAWGAWDRQERAEMIRRERGKGGVPEPYNIDQPYPPQFYPSEQAGSMEGVDAYGQPIGPDIPESLKRTLGIGAPGGSSSGLGASLPDWLRPGSPDGVTCQWIKQKGLLPRGFPCHVLAWVAIGAAALLIVSAARS